MNPNPDNYCTLEMARKLQAAGIVLETAHYYRVWIAVEGTKCSMIVTREERDKLSYDPDKYVCDCPGMVSYIPAPSMAEAWRELPEGTRLVNHGEDCAAYSLPDAEHIFYSTNPTDALCELLIWLKGEKK